MAASEPLPDGLLIHRGILHVSAGIGLLAAGSISPCFGRAVDL
jgi:hypothetical protein